jgi:predicted GNAT family N-acyltransferase
LLLDLRVSDPEVIIVRTPVEMDDALSVRRRVFIEEQAVPAELEVDEHDGDPASVSTALHVLVRDAGLPVATGRLLLFADADGHAHIGRVAVLAEQRGRGYGRLVMERLQDRARDRGYAGITLAAQLHAIGFYEKLGYVPKGGVFLDAGIEHRWMYLDF